MDGDAIVAIVGSTVVAFVIRFANVVLVWLARVLDVDPPEPIPTTAETLRHLPPNDPTPPPS